jgi:hypothetical protein
MRTCSAATGFLLARAVVFDAPLRDSVTGALPDNFSVRTAVMQGR